MKSIEVDEAPLDPELLTTNPVEYCSLLPEWSVTVRVTV